MDINKETRIGSVAAYDYRTSVIFRKYNIDFCCHGERSITEVCEEIDLRAETLIYELKSAMALEERAYANFNYWPIDLLTDYIEKKHHRYTRERALLIRKDFYILTDLCGSSYPELLKASDLFNDVSNEIETHMKKEEDLLFPHIREIALARQQSKVLESAIYRSIEEPVSDFLKDHVYELNTISELTQQLQTIACPVQHESRLKSLAELIREFEADLYLHTHLENNILFPKAMEMDNTVVR